VFALSIPLFLVVSPILGTGATVALTVWTFWYAGRRIGPLRQAAKARIDAEARSSAMQSDRTNLNAGSRSTQ